VGATLRRDELHDGEQPGHDGEQQLHGVARRLHGGLHGVGLQLHGAGQQLHDEEHDEAPQHEPALHEQRDWP